MHGKRIVFEAGIWGISFYICSIFSPAAERRVPQEYSTVVEAVAAALPGDIVRVHGGAYTGNLVLDRPIHLIGDCEPVLTGSGHGPVVTLQTDGCAVEGFMIERSGMDMSASDAGIRVRSNGNVIAGNRLRMCLFGMYFEYAENNQIRGNTIEGLTERELGERGSGIHLFASHHNTIDENVVTGARDGIYFDHANFNTVRKSTFSGARYGLHYMSSDDNSFEDNRFGECIAGATIMFSRRMIVRGNAFIHNRGFSSMGALLKDCYDSEIDRNVFADNSTGLVIDNSMENLFRHNEILQNDLAVFLFSGADHNIFTENNFRENLSPIRILGRHTTTQWAQSGRGNYWSDYQGYDLDGDGIGDVPYKIQDVFEFLEAEHPTLRFFLVSPAADAIRTGEDTFPMFEFTHEVDPAPLIAPVTVDHRVPNPAPPRRRLRTAWATVFIGLTLCLGIVAAGRMRPRPHGRMIGA